MKGAYGQYAFSGGELGPLFRQRLDLERYGQSVRDMQNMLALAEGPAVRRPGTRFVARTKADADAVLVPFVFSDTDAVVIEATAGAFRFNRDGGQVQSGGAPYEVASPYAAGDVGRIRWAQSGDVLFLACAGHTPRTLSRAGHASWTLAEWITRDGPYLDVNTTAVTITPSATTGTVTLTASDALFAAGDVGRPVRLLHAATWGWCRITAYASPTSVTATVQSAFGATTATADWRLGAWTAALGWPAAVTFHENRLVWGGGQTVWMSKSADFDHHAPSDADGTVAADHGVVATLEAGRTNRVRWLLSAHRRLIVGTSEGPWTIQGGDGGPMTPATIAASRVHAGGVGDVPPVQAGTAVVYASRTRRKLPQLSYDFSSDNYVAPDLALAAAHVAGRGIRAMAWQAEPWSVLWIALDDGLLAGCTVVPELGVLAWHRHPIGGTGVRVRSVACIPGPDRDELWLVVERTVAGQTRRHVEIMAAPYQPADPEDRAGAYFVDGGLSYAGAPAAVVAGLSHLEGETVQVWADGAAHPDRVVSGGQITLQAAAGVIHVGLAAAARLVSLDLQPATQQGASAGKPRRVSSVTIGVLDSAGSMLAGVEGGAMDRMPERMDGDALGAAPALVTGARTIRIADGWRSAGLHVVVEQDSPAPLTVTALVPTVVSAA